MQVNVAALARTFQIHIEEKTAGDFPAFFHAVSAGRTLLLCDKTTRRFLPALEALFLRHGAPCGVCELPEAEPVADEGSVARVMQAAERYDYLLAVGAGTLNDLAKYVSFLQNKPCGVYATAPSMDGFASGVTPLIEGGFKRTRPAHPPRDILLDDEVLRAAPRIMVGAGVGDILAKHCCLTDWKMSALLFGEAYCEEAASLMRTALTACEESVPALVQGGGSALPLMNALIVSGLAMVIAGSSRPASGAEHHMSHFLEMDFLRRGERIPLHGVKVGLGTLVSLYLYHTLARRPHFAGREQVLPLIQGLPSVEEVERTLLALGCPVRFSALGITREVMREMLFEAYKLRDRFTVLALYCREGWMQAAADELIARFY